MFGVVDGVYICNQERRQSIVLRAIFRIYLPCNCHDYNCWLWVLHSTINDWKGILNDMCNMGSSFDISCGACCGSSV